MGSIDLSASDILYVDTSVYIYFFENNPEFGDIAESVFVEAMNRGLPIYGSEILLTELLVLPMREKDEALVNVYENLQSVIPTFRSVSVTREIAIEAAKLRAKYGWRTPDAIHMATAMECGVTSFVCSDEVFEIMDELRVVEISKA